MRSATVLVLALAIAGPALSATVSPSNLPAGFCDDVIAGDLSVGASLPIDTGGSCTLVLSQTGGPDLCVMRYNNVSVAPAGVISFSGSRALVLTAQGSFTVQGIVSAGVGGGGGFVSGLGASNLGSGGGGAGGDSTGGSGGASLSGQGAVLKRGQSHYPFETDIDSGPFFPTRKVRYIPRNCHREIR